MLVISHNYNVICKDSLLVQVIMGIEREIRIGIHRKYDSRIPAGNGKLSDKFYIIFAVFLRNQLKVHVDSIEPIGFCFIRQLRDQIRSGIQCRQECVIIKLLKGG